MRILAIANEVDILCYAYFGDEKLVEYGKKSVEDLAQLYQELYEFSYDKKITYIVMGWVDLSHLIRKNAIKLTRLRTLVKLICEQLGIGYATPKTYGWEKYLFGDRIQGKRLEREKIEIVNKLYDIGLVRDELNFQNDGLGIADAIILGGTFAINKYKKVGDNYYGL